MQINSCLIIRVLKDKRIPGGREFPKLENLVSLVPGTAKEFSIVSGKCGWQGGLQIRDYDPPTPTAFYRPMYSLHPAPENQLTSEELHTVVNNN